MTLLAVMVLWAGEWRRHEIYQGGHNATAVAGRLTGGKGADVVTSVGGKTLLLAAPDWKPIVIEHDPKHGCIHSELLDCDGDGDLDWVGARYQPGLIFWLERPAEPLTQPWKYHLLDDQVDGIHGLLVGDVDRDGMPDLLANSAQPKGRFPNAIVWYKRTKTGFDRHVIAAGDAPGLSHYIGLGDIDGDGRPDVCSGAKGGEQATPGSGYWFAWWRAPTDPTQPFTKMLISASQPGATNIHPADVNRDGKVDLVASRGHGVGVVWFEAPTFIERWIDPLLVGPHCLTVADFDQDGDSDVATCAKDDKLACWYENDGHGHFQRHVLATNQAAYDIRAVDMDGDDDLDILIAGQTSKNIVWLENPLR